MCIYIMYVRLGGARSIEAANVDSPSSTINTNQLSWRGGRDLSLISILLASCPFSQSKHAKPMLGTVGLYRHRGPGGKKRED